MDEDASIAADDNVALPDPRETLATWANSQDEWLRYIVRQVLNTGRPLVGDDQATAYALLRQEKGLDERTLPVEAALTVDAQEADAELPLAIAKLSGVTGVNAIVSGAVIEPHVGITILYGENGTGKTGYSRIFKALAGSRTADVILKDIAGNDGQEQSAVIDYIVGDDAKTFVWTGEQGHPPFTRMSIFDSPSVNFHVDDDLEYVYVPSVLALFNHVIAGLQAVKEEIDAAVAGLATSSTTLLSRFPRESAVYPLVEALGASSDLAGLKARSDGGADVEQRIEVLRQAVAALEANTIPTQIAEKQRHERALRQAQLAATTLASLDVGALNGAAVRLVGLREDYKTFRSELFAAADLPADPDASWETFVESGETYREHLDDLGVHDPERCLYCRQPLSDAARELVTKYAAYLADKISEDIGTAEAEINERTGPVVTINLAEVDSFAVEFDDREDRPPYYCDLITLRDTVSSSVTKIRTGATLDTALSATVSGLEGRVNSSLSDTVAAITELTSQALNRAEALTTKKGDLAELVAAAELAKSWSTIEAQVAGAKEADRLRLLVRSFQGISRAVTELAKSASDQLINQNFDKLFAEECAALRAPSLKVEFVGRQGRAQRRKTLTGNHKPSKVLSEGEQKALALADFLAEARLAGITAPVIFDDPVSSLDHRRINEVARRIASLADENQVIVFTHDIFFATTLLSLFEESRRCSYFQITDEDGKGRVTRATGPRWDSLSSFRTNINKTIEAARAADGEARAALVAVGYDLIRSWCEVFTETELLKGVSQRYQPNIRMTLLPEIKSSALPAAIAVVSRVFDNACRYILGHSQPLVTLGVAPTLPGLEAHWKELQDARKAHLDAPAGDEQ
jgi:energy-coupling factor transporter ATP-binding protein EcfA2